MAVRATMSALISRVRSLINDPTSTEQTFNDQEIQDILDQSRLDAMNQLLTPKPVFNGSDIQYLDYFAAYGGWEDGTVFKQYLTRTVTPTLSEPIPGHWQFETSTLPPIYITGKSYDVYRAAADLLERWSAKMAFAYDFTSDGQTFRRSQMTQNVLNLANSYRRKQRAVSISAVRTDLASPGPSNGLSLGPTAVDYMSSGDGR